MTTETKPRRSRAKAAPKAAEQEVEDPIEGEIVEAQEMTLGEDGPETAQLPAVRGPQAPSFDPGTAALAILSDDEFETRLTQMRKGRERVVRILHELLEKDTDYGIIPGTDDRHTLFKAGAEKLCQFYGLVSRIVVTPRIGDNVTAPAVRYDAECFIHLGSTDGPIVATGYGTANSWETRYLRPATPCPLCEAPALMKSKFGPGMYCNPKKGGCGANVPMNEVPASDPKGVVTTAHDLGNTLAKMAEKRAHVDATLRATATSGLFTQDVIEDENSDTQLGPTTTVDDTPQETVTAGGAHVDADGVVTGRQETVDLTGNPDEDHAAASEVPREEADRLSEEHRRVATETGPQVPAGEEVDKILRRPDPLAGEKPADPEPEFTPSDVEGVGRGGVTERANKIQIETVKTISKENRANGLGLVGLINFMADHGALDRKIAEAMLQLQPKPMADALTDRLERMSGNDIGKLIHDLRDTFGEKR